MGSLEFVSCSIYGSYLLKLAGRSISSYPDITSNVSAMAAVSLCFAPRVELYMSLAYHQCMSMRNMEEKRRGREIQETADKTS